MKINDQKLLDYLQGKSFDHVIFEEIKALAEPTATDAEIEKLSEIVRSGKAREHYKINDVVTIAGHELEIIGFNHDEDATDATLPTITLMSKTLLPPHRMHGSNCERGWIDTELRAWLNGEILEKLPEALLPHIRPTKKITHNYKGETHETIDRLYIPSESELFGSAIWSNYEDGPRYEAFATSEIRVRLDEDGDGCWYWTRSFVGGYSTYCASVRGSGFASHYSATNTTIRAPLCFTFA